MVPGAIQHSKPFRSHLKWFLVEEVVRNFPFSFRKQTNGSSFKEARQGSIPCHMHGLSHRLSWRGFLVVITDYFTCHLWPCKILLLWGHALPRWVWGPNYNLCQRSACLLLYQPSPFVLGSPHPPFISLQPLRFLPQAVHQILLTAHPTVFYSVTLLTFKLLLKFGSSKKPKFGFPNPVLFEMCKISNTPPTYPTHPLFVHNVNCKSHLFIYIIYLMLGKSHFPQTTSAKPKAEHTCAYFCETYLPSNPSHHSG